MEIEVELAVHAAVGTSGSDISVHSTGHAVGRSNGEFEMTKVIVVNAS